MPTQLGSYHNHLAYCDGSGTAVEYAAAAQQANLHSFGLSCHMAVPFASDWNMPPDRLAAYRDEVRTAASTPRPLLGLEVDYLHPDVATDGAQWTAAILSELQPDYVVLSTHYCGLFPAASPWAGRAWSIDSDGGQFASQLELVYHGDITRLMRDYWQRVTAMASQPLASGLPAIIGHVDKAKMWNIGGRYFDEAATWYLAAADEALQAITRHGQVVEINTAGLTRPHGESYPGPRLLHRCHQLGIPVTVSADAHRPSDIDRRFQEAVTILRDAGHREIVVLEDGRWRAQPLA